MTQKDKRIILSFVSTPSLTHALAASAVQLGYRIETVARADQLQPLNDARSNRPVEPGENIFGREGRLLDLVASRHPELVIFEIANDEIPWKKWLARLKSSPATRRRPVLAVAATLTPALRLEAETCGADEIVDQATFLSELTGVISILAGKDGTAAVDTACRELISPDAAEGIAAFNRGDYYEAHDGLEFAWKEDPGPGRDLYRALLQVAVALYQVKRGNYKGAVKMLLRVKQWFAPLPDHCRGVNVVQVRADAEAAYAQLIELGPVGIDAFDFSQIGPIQYAE